MAKKTIITTKIEKFPVKKRTSIGRDGRPLNKHRRKQVGKVKGYRGQGRP